MQITRIVMNDNRTDTMDGRELKRFVKGQVYDSRFPLDIPEAADGIQHSITDSLIVKFVKNGWAHEETWEEWEERIASRQQSLLALPNKALAGHFMPGMTAVRASEGL